MAVLPGSSGEMPEGGNDPSLGGVGWMQDVTEQGVRDRTYSDVMGPFSSAKSSLFGNLLGGFFQGLLDVFNGLNPANWLPRPAIDFAEYVRDGQEDLNNRTDLLSPLLDYGSWCCRPGSAHARFGGGVMPFNHQIGPVKGMTHMGDNVHNGGRIRLDDIGLYDIRATVTVSWYGIGPFRDETLSWYIRVIKPDGGLHSVHSELGYFMQTWNTVTMSSTSTVVVDEPGYFVDIYVLSPGDRGWRSGPKWTRLSIQHISREVTAGDGSEQSTADNAGTA